MPPTKPKTGRRRSSRYRDVSPGVDADVKSDAAVPYDTEEMETAAPMDAQVVRPGTLSEGPARSYQETAEGLVPILYRKKKRRPSRRLPRESMPFEPEGSHARPGSVASTWPSVSGPGVVDNSAIYGPSINEASMAGSGYTSPLPATQGMMTFADMQAQGYHPALTQVSSSFPSTLPSPAASAGPVRAPTVPAPVPPQGAPGVQLPAQAPQAAITAQPLALLQNECIPIVASSQGTAQATVFAETTGSGSVPDFSQAVPVSPGLPPARDGRAQRPNNASLDIDVAEKSYAQDTTVADYSGGRVHPSAAKSEPGAAKGKSQRTRMTDGNADEARPEYSKKGDVPEFEYADEMPVQSQKWTVGATKKAGSTDCGAALRHRSVVEESPSTPSEAYGRPSAAGVRRMVPADAVVLDRQLTNRLVTVLSKVEKLALTRDENRGRKSQERDERNMMAPAKPQGVNISIQGPFSQKSHHRSRDSEIAEDGSDDDNDDGGGDDDGDDGEERQYSDRRESKRRLKKSNYSRRSASEESFEGLATGPQRRLQSARSAEKPRRRIPGSLSKEDEDEEPIFEVPETSSISGWPSHTNYQYNHMPTPAHEPSPAFGTTQTYLYPEYPPQKYSQTSRYPGIGRPFGPIYHQSRMSAPFPQPGANEFLYSNRSTFDPFNRLVSPGPRSNVWAPEQYPYLNDVPPGNNYAQQTAYKPSLREVSGTYSAAPTRAGNYGNLQAYSPGAANQQQLQHPQQHAYKSLQEGGCPASSVLPYTSHSHLTTPHHQPPNAVPCGPGDPTKTSNAENFASKRNLTFSTPSPKARGHDASKRNLTFSTPSPNARGHDASKRNLTFSTPSPKARGRDDNRAAFRMAVTPKSMPLARREQGPQVTTASRVTHRAPAKVIACSARRPITAENVRCPPPRVKQTNLNVAAPSSFGRVTPTVLPPRRFEGGFGGLQDGKRQGLSLEELLRYEDDMGWEEEMRERTRRLWEDRIREEERLLLRERLLEQERLLREEFRADLDRKRGTDDTLLRLPKSHKEHKVGANAAVMDVLAKAPERRLYFTTTKPVQDAEVQAGWESEPLFMKDGEIESEMTMPLGAKKLAEKTRRQCSDAGLEWQPLSQQPSRRDSFPEPPTISHRRRSSSISGEGAAVVLPSADEPPKEAKL